jgi:predicted tellurium resistance membrane protein TerC
MSVSLLGWLALIGALLAMLSFDLFFAHRSVASLRSAAGWSALWLAVGVAFGLVVLAAAGGAAAGSYWAGFLMEKALSLDNVFVIAVLLSSFAVPRDKQPDVLTFGIVVALVLRTAFIVAGVALIELFHPVLYLMGALLVATGIRLAFKGDGSGPPRGLTALRRLRVPPLVAALLAVALADVVFAIDSIPAVLAITTDTFLVFAANAFALLGLRALYVLLDGAAARFHYLHYGLATLLVFVGAKMLLEDVIHLPVAVSLGAIVGILGAAIGASLARRPAPQEA